MEMSNILATLRTHMPFKPDTREGDIILVGMPTGLFYGIVQAIEPNIKKNWYNLSFKLLVVPPVDITWILRVPQMNGEIFTINGQEHFVIALDTRPGEKRPGEEQPPKPHRPVRRLTLVKQDAKKKEPPPETA